MCSTAQLSAAVAEKLNLAKQTPGSAGYVGIGAGQVTMVGRSMSVTVITKLQVEVLFEVSVTVHVTVVVPKGNTAPAKVEVLL